jgi:hypothetical protein
MRFSRLVILGLGLAAVGACSKDYTSDPVPPPLAGVRIINALSDTGRVDVKMVDQIEWSAFANGLAFRAGTEHQPTEAKARHIRVFSFASQDISVVQQQLADTTITFAANTKVTLLLTGSARSKTVRFVVIVDAAPTPAATQIAVRLVDTSPTQAVDGYITTNAADAIGASPTLAAGPLATSPYILRTSGTTAIRITNAGTTTVTASAQGPTATTPLSGQLPLAAVNSGGSGLSAFYFPPGAAGSANASLTTPAVVWFVDLVPAG